MYRNQIYDSVTQTVFDTPLVKLGRIIPKEHATVLLKLEFFNPLSSVKDRIGRAMIEAALNAEVLNAETEIIEPTSGNTGIALAFVAAENNLKLTLVMPDTMSVERRQLLAALGANLVLTPGNLGMKGAIDKAYELADANSNSWIPQQFENPSNPAIHETTTGPEIWNDTQGTVDIFLAGIGTGGTFTGVSRYLKRRKKGLLCYAVEPADSPVLSKGKAGPHEIQGIGAGFIPKNLDTTLIDGIETVSSGEAYTWGRRLAKEEGILAGISSGANVAVAARLAEKPENKDKTIVTIAASCGERYLSTKLFRPS
ncbi:MAG: cysteine synthase A [Planctomycetaceae bacterium]|jgi:cysteine synthase A|nr:cysteine synthase A [Planctomycetaceae bacterium]